MALARRLAQMLCASANFERFPFTSMNEMLAGALSTLEDFASDLQENYLPPGIPYDKEKSARGWSIRLETISEKIAQSPRHEKLLVCSRLAAILSKFDEYLEAWESRVAEIDPLLRDYEFMPGDHKAMDSVRILAERVNLALWDVMADHFQIEE